MAQSIYYVNDRANQYGTIALEMGVFESIANNILAETDGVVIDNKILKGNRESAVAWLEGTKLNITINLKVKYGTIVSKVSKDVQDRINTTIQELTNVIPESVNVNVIGIEFN